MIVSWNWLKEYVALDMPLDDLTERLTMSGLNHEETLEKEGDQAIDLEVTSNRPDCLGHIGVAREIAVLYETSLKMPSVEFTPSTDSIENHCTVTIESPKTCFRYTARMIKGVKIGPSPQWLQDRLTAIGIGVVNNVVDVTNYVMMECGQPLHAFDFAKINDGKIIVRDANKDETMVAIDHSKLTLQPGMCVIADSQAPVALGGVMGGADSEISDDTTDVLLEAAYFDQLAVRNAARRLKLHSPSSFRFERNIDSAMLDWASQRACSMIQQLAGGEILDGFIDVGEAPQPREPVNLRYGQIKRLLGIEIPIETIRGILAKLGLSEVESLDDSITVTPPSWRKDLTREVDLIEEVGRIYGFDKIPDTVNVPMAASHQLKVDRLLRRVRTALTLDGYDEAMTTSLVPEVWSEAFSPWTQQPPMISSQPMLGVLDDYSHNIGSVNLLRRSLVPSLIEARRINEYRNNLDASLFETAVVYLPVAGQDIPDQPMKLGCVTGEDYYQIKGVVEALVASINPALIIQFVPCQNDLLDLTRSAEMRIGEKTLGWLGEVSPSGRKRFGLRSDASVAELDLTVLEDQMVDIPVYQSVSPFPAVSRDFNFVLNDHVAWAQLEAVVRESSGSLLESVEYRETFRNESKDGPGKKRVLLSVTLRSSEATLTGEQVDECCNAIVEQCKSRLQALLLA